MRQIGTRVCIAVALVTGCKFSPEQLLLPEVLPDQTDAAAAEPRRGAMAAAVSSAAGRPAAAAISQRAQGGATASRPAAAGSGSAATQDAGPSMPTRTNAGMSGEAEEMTATAGMGGSGSAGNAAAGSGGTAEPPGPADPTCDFSGVWITKQVAVSLALEQPQFMNTWGYYEVEQSGREFVVKKHIDCGAEVLGSGTVTLSRATMEGNVQHNMQDGRKGSFELMNGKCVFDIAHFWSVRGADETRFVPNPRDSTMSMAELARLKPLPTPRMPDGAFDLEGDGELGAAGQINGIVSGVRNSCQRDWDRWFTAEGYEITPSMDFATDLKVRMEYESEESVMAPTSGLLVTPSEPTNDWDHIMYLRFLGRNLDDPRAQAIVHSEAVETCYAVQDAMPAEELRR